MEYPGAWAALPFGTHEERTPIPVRVKPFKSRPARSEQNEAVRRFAYGLTTAKERRYLRYRLKLAEERQQQVGANLTEQRHDRDGQQYDQ